MDTNRLYPPVIAGTLPSFYKSSLGTTLVVPFSMNTAVSVSAIRGLRIRIKDSVSDITLAQLDSISWGDNNGQMEAVFSLNDVIDKFVVGNHYKAQLAYYTVVNEAKVYGYFSTVGILKFTTRPILEIAGFKDQTVNMIGTQKIIGTYYNADSSEKVFQYRFLITTVSGATVEDSGWLLHNSYSDTDLNNSTDSYVILGYLSQGATYRIQYQVITGNGLKENSLIYQFAYSVDTSAELKFDVRADLDYDNGRVKVFIPNPADYPKEKYKMELPEGILSGSFLLLRSSAKDNFMNWEILSNFNYANTYDTFVYWDYTVEAGETYLYAMQQYNTENVFSPRKLSNKITAYFEDIFLYDGMRQLKVRFNPKVASFKEIVSETKKTTLGRQYPFIMRNGAVRYKEFSINGLLSYLLDEQNLFASDDELKRNHTFKDTTDITDENMALEHNFKMLVLEWLNNGKSKIFRSPQEGNYIVRLTNISLSPNDTLSRMLHTFQCTASQIDDFSVTKLEEYALLSPGPIRNIYTTKTVRISLRDVYQRYVNQFGSTAHDKIWPAVRAHDLTEGREVLSIHLTNTTFGLIFVWGDDQNFIIDATNSYEYERDTPLLGPLYVLNPEINGGVPIVGDLELEVVSDANELFNNSTSVSTYNFAGWGARGRDILPDGITDKNMSYNLLNHFNFLPHSITKMYRIKYSVPQTISAGQYYAGATNADNNLENWWNNLDELTRLSYANSVFIKDAKQNVFWPTGSSYDTFVKMSIEDINTTIQFGDVVQDVLDFQSDTSGVNFEEDIPLTDKGVYYLSIGAGVNVEMFFQGAYTSFGIVDNVDKYPVLNEAYYAADSAYATYLAHSFNFEQVSKQQAKNASIVYIYEDRAMHYIDATQVEKYANDGVTAFYIPATTPYNSAIIAQSRANWENAESVYNEYLQEALEAEKGE